MEKSHKTLTKRAADFGGRIEEKLSDILKINFKNTLKIIFVASSFYIILTLLIAYSVSISDPTEANFAFGFLIIMGIMALILLIFAGVLRILVFRKS